mgnify:CR=1 FL=1
MTEISSLPIFGGTLARREVESYLKHLSIETIPVNGIRFSPRINSCLRSLQIETLAALLGTRPDRLLGVKNFGRTSLGELQEAIRHFLASAERGETL